MSNPNGNPNGVLRKVSEIKEGSLLYCTVCKEYKQTYDFYITQGSYRSFCKQCCNKKTKENYLKRAKKDDKLIIDENGRQCIKCLKYKPRSEYYAHNLTSTGHVSKCKDCGKDYYKSRINKVSVLIAPKTKVEFKERYPAPNIDEVIGFIPVIHENEETW